METEKKPVSLSKLKQTAKILPIALNDSADFKSPLPVKKLGSKTQQAKKSNPQPRRQPSRSSRKGGLVQKTLTDNFKKCDVNPEHLQMAIALSKSVEDYECSSETNALVTNGENDVVARYPSTQQVRENFGKTLERFGFRSVRAAGENVDFGKIVEAANAKTKKKKTRNRILNPILFKRTEEERQELINQKVAEILTGSCHHNNTFKNIGELKVHSMEIKPYLAEGRRMLFSFGNDRTLEELTKDVYYVDGLNLPRSEYVCGSLLKCWEKIPGREVSPPRLIRRKSTECEENAIVVNGAVNCNDEKTARNKEFGGDNEEFAEIEGRNEEFEEIDGRNEEIDERNEELEEIDNGNEELKEIYNYKTSEDKDKFFFNSHRRSESPESFFLLQLESMTSTSSKIDDGKGTSAKIEDLKSESATNFNRKTASLKIEAAISINEDPITKSSENDATNSKSEDRNDINSQNDVSGSRFEDGKDESLKIKQRNTREMSPDLFDDSNDFNNCHIEETSLLNDQLGVIAEKHFSEQLGEISKGEIFESLKDRMDTQHAVKANNGTIHVIDSESDDDSTKNCNVSGAKVFDYNNTEEAKIAKKVSETLKFDKMAPESVNERSKLIKEVMSKICTVRLARCNFDINLLRRYEKVENKSVTRKLRNGVKSVVNAKGLQTANVSRKNSSQLDVAKNSEENPTVNVSSKNDTIKNVKNMEILQTDVCQISAVKNDSRQLSITKNFHNALEKTKEAVTSDNNFDSRQLNVTKNSHNLLEKTSDDNFDSRQLNVTKNSHNAIEKNKETVISDDNLRCSEESTDGCRQSNLPESKNRTVASFGLKKSLRFGKLKLNKSAEMDDDDRLSPKWTSFDEDDIVNDTVILEPAEILIQSINSVELKDNNIEDAENKSSFNLKRNESNDTVKSQSLLNLKHNESNVKNGSVTKSQSSLNLKRNESNAKNDTVKIQSSLNLEVIRDILERNESNIKKNTREIKSPNSLECNESNVKNDTVTKSQPLLNLECNESNVKNDIKKSKLSNSLESNVKNDTKKSESSNSLETNAKNDALKNCELSLQFTPNESLVKNDIVQNQQPLDDIRYSSSNDSSSDCVLVEDDNGIHHYESFLEDVDELSQRCMEASHLNITDHVNELLNDIDASYLSYRSRASKESATSLSEQANQSNASLDVNKTQDSNNSRTASLDDSLIPDEVEDIINFDFEESPENDCRHAPSKSSVKKRFETVSSSDDETEGNISKAKKLSLTSNVSDEELNYSSNFCRFQENEGYNDIGGGELILSYGKSCENEERNAECNETDDCIIIDADENDEISYLDAFEQEMSKLQGDLTSGMLDKRNYDDLQNSPIILPIRRKRNSMLGTKTAFKRRETVVSDGSDVNEPSTSRSDKSESAALTSLKTKSLDLTVATSNKTAAASNKAAATSNLAASSSNSTASTFTPDRIVVFRKNVTSQPSTSTTTPDRIIVKKDNVTPMPNFESMSSPQLETELDKFGVKKLKRRRGVEMLRYLYETTHPVVSTYAGENDDGKVVKKLRKGVKSSDVISDRVVKRLAMDGATAGRNVRMVKSSSELPIPMLTASVRNAPSAVTNLSVTVRVSDVDVVGDIRHTPEELIFERRRSRKIAGCQLPLHIAWHNFLAANAEIRRNLLLYEPLQVEVLYGMLKDLGFSYHIQDLITFLDKKCVTIRIAQGNQKNRH